MMNLREQLLYLSDAYAGVAAGRGRTGPLPLSTVSSRIFDDGKTLDRVAGGGDLTTGNFERALQWFSDNWPAAHPWPDGIARPARAEAAP